MAHAAIEPTMPHAPISTAAFEVGNSASASARAPDVMNAAPAPCRTRAAMSIQIVGATEVSATPIVNAVIPARNARLRPCRSPSRPPTSRRDDWATRNPVAAHPTVLRATSSNRRAITGSAMAISVASTM